MSAYVLLFHIDEETGEICVPPLKMGHAVWIMLQRKTKTELMRDLVHGEMGFCEEDARVYFKHKFTDRVYYAQMAATT